MTNQAEATIEKQGNPWKLAILTSMADYIDAGSIVGIGASLAVWTTQFSLQSSTVGLITALGPNALAAGIGAIVGGRLGDAIGRKRIYQFDLLFYAFGTLFLIFANGVPMLMIGSIIVGLAVGIDIPTSWALLSESSPARSRSKLMGVTNILWNLGPVVVLAIAIGVAPLGEWGPRIIFAHLFVLSLVTWAFRRGMGESLRWKEKVAGQTANPLSLASIRDLFRRSSGKAIAFTGGVFLFWNLAAGTNGVFLPYLLSTLGVQGQAGSVAIQGLGFLCGLLSVAFIFMRFADGTHRRVMFTIGASLQALAFLLFALFPLTTPIAIANVVLFGVGQGMAQYPMIRVWLSELFPTSVRTTAQGLVYGAVRIALFFWSLAVPVIAMVGVSTLGWLLTIFLIISGLIGAIFMPKTAGKSLEQIEAERA
ncbi:MAG: iolF [Glaciihabitans sp.]|nr:iolF [Glaciihabitans sp.]MDQ1555049.1 transporter, family, inositol transporter [Actinomycetota bacterium]